VIFLCFRPVSPAGEIYTSNEQSKYQIMLYYLLGVVNSIIRIFVGTSYIAVYINHKGYISVVLLHGLLWL